jgi:hypothetical protein
MGTSNVAGTVSISGNSNIVAVGDTQSNRVVIYTSDNNWGNPGIIINAPSGLTNFGKSHSLSEDGNTLIVGSDGNATIYISDNNWSNPGINLIIPPSSSNSFGSSVSMLNDGSGAIVGDYNGGIDNSGSVTYYRADNNWSNPGINISKPNNMINFGETVSAASNNCNN